MKPPLFSTPATINYSLEPAQSNWVTHRRHIRLAVCVKATWRKDGEPAESIRGNDQEVGGKRSDQEGIYMKGFTSKGQNSKGKPKGYSRELQRRECSHHVRRLGCGSVDSQWNNALGGPPERLERKPAEEWKFGIIGELKVFRRELIRKARSQETGDKRQSLSLSWLRSQIVSEAR